ncbi:MAG: ABC transporter permease [Thermodesulfovibrionales bacterium]
MQILKLIIRNSLRHKLRTFLTVLGMLIAILAFGLLRTVVSAWYAGVEASSANRLVVRNAISLVFLLPATYREKIRQIEGVESVSWGNWFGGVYIDEKNFFPNFAVDPATYFDLYPEFLLSPEEKKAFLLDRKGFVAGRKVAERFGWKVGDPVTLKGTIFPGTWDFVLRGIYRGRDKGTDETQFFFHWDYLNESVRKTMPRRADQIGFFIVGIRDPGEAAAVAARIDSSFRNSVTETLTETERAFQMGFVSMTEAIVIAIQLVSFVVIVIIMAVAANTMAMSARERLNEFAVIKTLGFGSGFIGGLIFGESLLISMAGCLLGVAATFPAASAFGSAMSAFLPVFHVSRETILMDIAASLVVAVVAAIIPTWRAITIRIVDGLRRIA